MKFKTYSMVIRVALPGRDRQDEGGTTILHGDFLPQCAQHNQGATTMPEHWPLAPGARERMLG